VQAAILLLVGGTSNENLVALDRKGHTIAELTLKGAEGALNSDDVAVCNLNRNTGGDYHGHSTNS
jgi:hypothetical protein